MKTIKMLRALLSNMKSGGKVNIQQTKRMTKRVVVTGREGEQIWTGWREKWKTSK